MSVALSRARSSHVQPPRKLEEMKEGNVNVMVQKRVVVPVVYYLCRNGQLEHPHFVEIPLSSPHGLFLRDVIHRLNLLRGKSMVSCYSWSSKRSYKNGYVWQDLEDNDLIYPVHGEEYVLKGSIIPHTTLSSSPSAASKSPERSSFSTTKKDSTPQSQTSSYKVYKAESIRDFAAADASTQTDDRRHRAKAVVKNKPEIEEQECSIELSPPPSDSSQETLDSLIKSDEKSNASSSLSKPVDQTVEYYPSGRIMKASSVLMSLFSCGSVSFREGGVTAGSDNGLPRLSCVRNRKADGGMMKETIQRNVSSSFAKMALEDKEYFSGSLIETGNKINSKDDNNTQLISLKRSSSYNADRSSHVKLLGGNEVDEAKAKCVPRRQNGQPSHTKDGISEITSVTIDSKCELKSRFR